MPTTKKKPATPAKKPAAKPLTVNQLVRRIKSDSAKLEKLLSPKPSPKK